MKELVPFSFGFANIDIISDLTNFSSLFFAISYKDSLTGDSETLMKGFRNWKFILLVATVKPLFGKRIVTGNEASRCNIVLSAGTLV